MDAELVFALARSLERLGIVAVAGLSIWAGFRLFQVASESEANANIEGHGIKLSLTRVGPGVFFSLFGSIVLIYALASPVKLPIHNKNKDNQSQGLAGDHVNYGMDGKNNLTYKAAMGALNRIRLLADQAKLNSLDKNELNQLIEAAAGLTSAEECLIDAEFGQGAYAEYKMVLSLCTQSPAQCDSYLKIKQKKEWYEKVDEFNSEVSK